MCKCVYFDVFSLYGYALLCVFFFVCLLCSHVCGCCATHLVHRSVCEVPQFAARRRTVPSFLSVGLWPVPHLLSPNFSLHPHNLTTWPD